MIISTTLELISRLVSIHSVNAEEASIIHFLLVANCPSLLLLLLSDILWDALLAQGLVHGHNNGLREMFQTQVTSELALLHWRRRLCVFTGGSGGFAFS